MHVMVWILEHKHAAMMRCQWFLTYYKTTKLTVVGIHRNIISFHDFHFFFLYRWDMRFTIQNAQYTPSCNKIGMHGTYRLNISRTLDNYSTDICVFTCLHGDRCCSGSVAATIVPQRLSKVSHSLYTLISKIKIIEWARKENPSI